MSVQVVILLLGHLTPLSQATAPGHLQQVPRGVGGEQEEEGEEEVTQIA